MLLNDTINIISLIASSIGLLILLSLAFKRPKLMKRVSLQLQAGIALLDITRHIQLYIVYSAENNLCTFIAFYGFFSDHLYVFLNVAIALNLHLFLLLRYRPRHYMVWFYFIASIGLSLVINLFPLGFGYLGKSIVGSCYINPSIANHQLVKLILVHILNWPGIIYCLVISVIVISQYIFGKIKDTETDIVWLPEVRGLSCMISLNSFTCFLTMFLYLLEEILYDLFEFDSPVLFGLSGFLARSTGTLNLICLLLDYQVWFAIIGCAMPHKTSPSTSYELSSKKNNGQLGVFRSSKNTNLILTDSCGSNETEPENLINFL